MMSTLPEPAGKTSMLIWVAPMNAKQGAVGVPAHAVVILTPPTDTSVTPVKQGTVGVPGHGVAEMLWVPTSTFVVVY